MVKTDEDNCSETTDNNIRESNVGDRDLDFDDDTFCMTFGEDIVEKDTNICLNRQHSILKFDHNVFSHSKESDSSIAWLHIPRLEKTDSQEHEKISCVEQTKSFVWTTAVVLELVTLFKYFIRFPILDLFLPKGAPGERRHKRFRAISILALLSLATVYACYVALRYCTWETDCFTWDWRFLVIAKLSGKLTTVFVLTGLLLMFRALTSYFHEIPWKVGVGWRRLHIDCFIIAMACAVSHTVAHSLRIVNTLSKNWSFEAYFLSTGVFLWLLLLSQYAPYFVLRFLQKFRLTSTCLSLQHGMKWWFRHSHMQLFKVFALFYFLHAAGDISPFVLYMVWLFCEYQFQLDVTDCTVRFTPSRQNYEYCELITTYTNKMPDEFGYYCRVYLLGTFSSCTQIPLEDGHTTIFKIKKSIQTDKLLEYVNTSYGAKEGL